MLCFPNAKINIGLYVLNTRPDGYHNLETVFFPIPLKDNLEVISLEDKVSVPFEFEQTGIQIACDATDNLAVRVFLSMQKEFQLPPCRIHLHKRIPFGAGLGGGSSDAAFMMRLLNEMFSLQLTNAEMKQRVSTIGADCAFFIDDTPCFATGIGDQLTPVDVNLNGKYIVLVKPNCSVSTRDAYADVICRDYAPVSLQEALLNPLTEWRGLIENDFEQSVFPKYPEIQAIKQTLYDMHAIYASMSGSGSSVFGIFDTPPQADLNEVFKGSFVVSLPLLHNIQSIFS